MSKLDHIVIGATSLEEGTAYIENKLKTKLSDIGYHDFMGTHNRVLRISNNIYLEVIAIDPNCKSPNRERWFNLDSSILQERLKKNPQVIGYVIETYDKTVLKHYFPFFNAKRGVYKWKFAMPMPVKNLLPSIMVDNGVIPSIINWESDKPIKKMKESQFELEKIEVKILKNQLSFKDLMTSLKQPKELTYLINKEDTDFISDYPKLTISIRNTLTNNIIDL